MKRKSNHTQFFRRWKKSYLESDKRDIFELKHVLTLIDLSRVETCSYCFLLPAFARSNLCKFRSTLIPWFGEQEPVVLDRVCWSNTRLIARGFLGSLVRIGKGMCVPLNLLYMFDNLVIILCCLLFYWFCPQNRSMLLQLFLDSLPDSARDALIRKLIGKFTSLSKAELPNHFVQKCFDTATLPSCDLIVGEISPEFPSLLTDRHGHIVVQHLTKRFLRPGALFPPSLASLLISSRHLLQQDRWGREVVITYDKARRINRRWYIGFSRGILTLISSKYLAFSGGILVPYLTWIFLADPSIYVGV